MHTIKIIAGGLVLLCAFIAVAILTGIASKAAAAKVFIPVWLIAALVNLWVGVTVAGYTVAQEAPILLVVFAVPAAAAYLASRALVD